MGRGLLGHGNIAWYRVHVRLQVLLMVTSLPFLTGGMQTKVQDLVGQKQTGLSDAWFSTCCMGNFTPLLWCHWREKRTSQNCSEQGQGIFFLALPGSCLTRNNLFTGFLDFFVPPSELLEICELSLDKMGAVFEDSNVYMLHMMYQAMGVCLYMQDWEGALRYGQKIIRPYR